ncbi:MAG: flagellar assembly protein FliH [Pseudohongiellaceae bacterium]
MDQHPFDVYARVTAKSASGLEVENWSPPIISDAGHLVAAEPRAETAPEPPAPDVVDEAAVVRKQAYDDGFTSGKSAGLEAGKNEGLSAGRQAALDAAKKEMQPKLGELNKLLTALSHSLNEEDYKLEKTLMDLVKHIACGVIRKELTLEPLSLMTVIKETISALPPNRDNIKIHLSPEDKKFADDAISEGGENWHVVSDPDLERGGCRIVTEFSEADMTVESRIDQVLEQLYEQQVLSPKPGDPDFEAAPVPAVDDSVNTGNEQASEQSSADIAETQADK